MNYFLECVNIYSIALSRIRQRGPVAALRGSPALRPRAWGYASGVS